MAGQLSLGSVVVLWITINCLGFGLGSMRIEDVFPHGTTNTLYTLHYDPQTGRSAVGGVNQLTLLGPDLKPLHKIKTGPTMENIECPPPWLNNCTCKDTSNMTCVPYDKIPTDSVVKTIAVDGNILVYCTSSYSGTCRKLVLNDLQNDTFMTEFLINGDTAAPLVSVVSAGPEANSNFLYLGSSWSDRSRFREGDWPRVAALSAINLKDFKYLEEARGSTALYLKDVYKKQHFTVLYKYAFTYNGFNYFLMVQQKSLKSQEFESRIGRLCVRDPWFSSYTEIRLACSDDQARYNILTAAHVSSSQHGFEETNAQLFITFAQSYDKSYESLASSALCIYRMSDIEQAFTNVVKSCFTDGRMARVGPDQFVDADQCQPSNVPIDDQYCGMHNLNTPIEGSEWVRSYMQQDFQGTLLTAVTAARVKNNTVAFLGTESGSVFKVFVEYPNRAVKYDDLILAGAAIQKNFHLTNNSQHLMILGKHKVYKVKTYSCNQYKSCSSCMKAKDVLCGWCLANGRCGGLNECDQEIAWISSWDGSCPALSSIIPREIEARNTLTTKVSLAVKWLPQLESTNFECNLRYQNVTMNFTARRESASTVSCDHFQNLPDLPEASGSLTFDLDLMMNGHSILETEMVVYDCALLETCIGCTNSSLACSWCSQSHRCTYASDVDSMDQCRHENYIYSGTYTQQQKIRGNHGADQCPQLVTPATSVLLPSGLPSAVQIIAKNIQSHQHQLQCVFHMSDQVVLVPADVEENIEAKHFLIYCKDELLFYEESEPLKNISVDVYWGANKTVDNPSNIQVTLYKCEYLVSDCGHCLTLRETYKCGWCSNEVNRSMSSCSLMSQCPFEWLNHDQICPNPHVTRFYPLSGPLSGGTRLTVYGVNLGKQVSDLRNGVKVAGVRCVVQDENYLPSSSFVCITEGSHNPAAGPIAVRVANKYGTESEFKFTYVVPVVLEMWPLHGPISGGTEVTVSGQFLNTGSTVMVSLNSRKALTSTIRRNTTHLVFKTPSQNEPTLAEARFGFDRAVIPSHNFRYLRDPVVDNVKNVTAFYPGGGQLEILGSNLDSVQEAKLRVLLPDTGQTFTEECAGQATVLYCTIPSIDHKDWNNTVVAAEYGLVMDGVESLLNLSSRPDISPLFYHPIPQIFPVNLPLKYDKDLQLVIKGLQLDVLTTAAHFIVTVGGAICNVTFIDTNTILCVPPDHPHSVDSEGFATIMFQTGNYKQNLGVVEYAPRRSGSLAIILGVVFGVALPIILVVVLLFVCLYRQNKKNRLRTPYKKDYIDEFEGEDQMLQLSSPRSRDENRPKPAVTTPLMAQVSRSDLSDEEETPLHNLHNGSASRYADNSLNLDPNQNKTDDNVSRDSEDYDSIIPPKFLQNLLENLDDDNLRKMVEEVLIPRDQLELGRVLGKGHFGRVYHGTLKTPDKEVEVAVKTLQGRELDRATVESFLQEGMMMKNFDHTHVLQLLGVVISSGEYPMVILPYMSKGDLRSYVKDKNKTFTSRQLLGLAQQVAAGMAYLSKLNFVHRDLAARNCMIDDSDVVKVADFGLSKDLYDKDYYASKDRKRKMPIKWMALESLEEYLFTTKSDVWSFGVLMWELLTRGVTPYPDVDVFEVRNYLASGHRLRQPKYCPQQIYKIMLRCWAVSPAERPTFVDLVNQLEMIIRPPKSMQADPENDEPIYMNAAEAKESKPRPRVPPPPPPIESPPPIRTPPPVSIPHPLSTPPPVTTPPRTVGSPSSAKLGSPPPVPAKPALPKKPSIQR